MRDDLRSIRNSDKYIIFADKTRNLYETDKSYHDKLLLENITKTYKKATTSNYDNINFEAKTLAKEHGIHDRAECLARKPAFITLKDHKDNFENNPKC